MYGHRSSLLSRFVVGLTAGLALFVAVVDGQELSEPDWLILLKSGRTPQIRMRALVEVGPSWYVEGLVDPDARVRRYAVRRIMARADSISLAVLMEVLAHPEHRKVALDVSPSGLLRGSWGCDIPGLILLAEEGPPEYREWAFQALRTIVKSPVGRRHVAALAEDDSQSRQVALSHLLAYSGRFGAQFRGVEAGMRHPDRRVRESCLELLIDGRYSGNRERSDRDESYDLQIARRQVRALEVALQDPDRKIRDTALSGLSHLSGYPHLVAPVLLGVLRHPDPTVRCSAICQLSDLEPLPSAFTGELTRLLNDGDASVRMASIHVLFKYSPDHEVSRNAIQPLLAVLRTRGNRQRFCAAAHLHEIGCTHPDVLNTLVDLLDDPSWHMNAVRVLGSMGTAAASNPAVVPRLLSLLKAGDFRRRGPVIHALGHIAPSHLDVVPVLMEALRDSDRSIRMEAVDALGRTVSSHSDVLSTSRNGLRASSRCRTSDAICTGVANRDRLALAASLIHDADPDVRENVLLTLSAAGMDAASVAPLIAQAASDREASVRLAAVKALASVRNDESILPVFRRRLFDRSSDVRLAALQALMNRSRERISVHDIMRILGANPRGVRLRGAMSHASRSDRLADLRELRQVLNDGRRSVRRWAVEQLGAIAAYLDEAVVVMGQALSDRSYFVRRSAAFALSRLGVRARPALPALAAALLDDETVNMAAVALGELDALAREVVPALMEAMARRRFRNNEIASALVKMGKHALPAIAERFVRGDPQTRIRLVDLVDRMGPSMAGALAAALQDPHPEVRLAVVERLCRKGRSVTGLITPLLARLRDDYVCIRIGAVRALVKSPACTGVAAFRAALRDPCGVIRQEAAIALANLGPEAAAAVPDLIRRVKDDPSYIRYEAVLALTAIGPAARAALPALRAARAEAREPLRFAVDRAIAALE